MNWVWANKRNERIKGGSRIFGVATRYHLLRQGELVIQSKLRRNRFVGVDKYQEALVHV